VYLRNLIGIIGAALFTFLLSPSASASRKKDHPYRYSDVDISVSLGVGTVRTPEFAVIPEAYDILLQVEKGPPFFDLRCMVGLTNGTLDFKDCAKEPLMQADWTVSDGAQVVSRGSSSGFGGGMYTNKQLFKFLGSCAGKAGKKYVLEVKFIKDGTPLNVASPYLIVIQRRYH
jgi:hypothetical protein